MLKLKIFSRQEAIGLTIIFAILVGVSIPNFKASLRRERDQMRRDDLGALVSAIEKYKIDFGVYPPSSPDGKIMDCLKPGDEPYKDKKGSWVINPVSCEWGKDALLNLITKNIYISILPRDPDWQKNIHYLYMSDSKRYQLFASMEGENEAEVDPKIISENLNCGNRICNVGRSENCDIPKTLEQCATEDAVKLLEK